MADPRSHPLIAGVRRLGSARVEIGRVVEQLNPGKWVAVPGPAGEEAALVVIAPEQVLYVEDELPELPVRRLSEDERARLPELAALAHALALRAAEALGQFEEAAGANDHSPLLGLQVTLEGTAVVECWWRGAGLPVADVAARLAERLGRPVHLATRPGGPPRALAGSLGRIAGAGLEFGELARLRLGVPLGEPPAPAPGGYPRLASTVITPAGKGIVRSVSTRHRVVTVELEDGTRHEVPLEQVTPANE
uniref:Uncharacterized protein n=1 Tax=Thermorudis sp. TaxID=1969470 RepID=A0A7C2WHH4_9BACT